MDFNLTSLVKTIQDIDTLNSEIDILIDSLYRTGDRSFDRVITNSVRNQTAESLKTIGSTREERQKNLESIKQLLRQINKVTLTVAFEPSPHDVDEVVRWCRKNIADDVVLEFRHDPTILAGAIIEWNGKYIDQSYASKLEGALNEGV